MRGGTEQQGVQAAVATVAAVCSLRGLREGLSYSVSVVAFNQLSESPPATIDDITMTESNEQLAPTKTVMSIHWG